MFSKPRRAILAAAGLALVAGLATAPAVAQAGQQEGRPSQGASKVVPLSADLKITRTVDGQTEHEAQHMYRDNQGRTRTEAGTQVTISDPAGKTTLVLDTATHTYQRQEQQEQPAADAKSRTKDNQKLASPPKSLGKAEISGVQVEGRHYTVNLPAHGKLVPARTKEVTLWLSVDLQLPVQTKVVDERGKVDTTTYTNIKSNAAMPAGIFTVPAGYRAAASAAANGVQATCPLNNDDPVFLTSFGSVFVDSKNVNASTDFGQGCIFVADGAVFEYPLTGFPTVNLFQPFDQWFVFDCELFGVGACPLPFLPYVAFGDIVWVAATAAGPDTTTKDSLITLTVFPV
jgi:outer membrane lipoprotein-sorting protein